MKALGFATPNIGLLTDIVCCPGGDFCSLANAKSIPIAEAIQRRFDDLDYLYDLGDLELNMSGCMNACGHHHVGNIGILGVDKNGEEWYQISIGGAQGNDASLGKVIGPSFAAADVPDVIVRLVDVYVENRHEDERFIETVRRHRDRPVQGTRLCRSSLRVGPLVDDRWTLRRDVASLADLADGAPRDRAARVLARASRRARARAATSASGSRRTTIPARWRPTSARCR